MRRVNDLNDLRDMMDGGGGVSHEEAAIMRDLLIARELLTWVNDADGGLLVDEDYLPDDLWVDLLEEAFTTARTTAQA
jgi:hypothetical protein